MPEGPLSLLSCGCSRCSGLGNHNEGLSFRPPSGCNLGRLLIGLSDRCVRRLWGSLNTYSTVGNHGHNRLDAGAWFAQGVLRLLSEMQHVQPSLLLPAGQRLLIEHQPVHIVQSFVLSWLLGRR